MSWWPFSRGDITINLPKYNYSLGEVITGTIIIKLKKPIRANSVNIRLLGEEKVTQRINGKNSTRTNIIFDFDQPLDGEKDYPPKSPLTYNFQINIPQNIGQQTIENEALKTMVGVAQALGGSRKRIKWTLIGRLDIPGAIDLRKRVNVNIA